MTHIIYFLVAIASTTVGSLTGMGGGVIIKPVLDILGTYDVETIGILSSITVFSMSVVSVGRQLVTHSTIDFNVAIPLTWGSIAGGLLGQSVLKIIIRMAEPQLVTVVQNAVLCLLILIVFFYMRNKGRIKGFSISGIIPAALAGLFLGTCSSFLGIGGGPINVAIIIFLFGFDTKSAVAYSLITILFSQISKLSWVAMTTGFSAFDLTVLPAMVVGAIVGGFGGADLNKKLDMKTLDHAFNAVQLLVLALSVVNIVRNLL